VITGGLLRLTRDSKVKRRTRSFARISAQRFEPDTDAAAKRRLRDDDSDEDIFSQLMEEKTGPGTMTLHSANGRGPTPSSALHANSCGRGRGSARSDDDDDFDFDSDDDADEIYRRNVKRETSRPSVRATSLAL
jgi:hypothetical protein